MRVHPGFLAPKSKKWHFPAAFAVLLFLLLMNILRGPNEVVVAKEVAPIKVVDVVVSKVALHAGELLDKSKLMIERRPANTVPLDVVSDLSQVEGMVAAGPIPSGYPLASILIAKPVSHIPLSADAEMINNKLDPIEALLQEINSTTVAMPIRFSGRAPARGTRVALVVNNYKGDSVLIQDSAWVAESYGSDVVVRIPPDNALYVQSVLKLSGITVNYIEIPSEGKSPYADHVISNIEDLQVALGFAGEGRKKEMVKNDGPRTFRSYAWVKGTQMRYGLDDRGLIYMVDEDGREVAGPVSSGLR